MDFTQLSLTDNLLILALESTSKHNLDEFGYSVGRFRMFVYEKLVKSRLEVVPNFI